MMARIPLVLPVLFIPFACRIKLLSIFATVFLQESALLTAIIAEERLEEVVFDRVRLVTMVVLSVANSSTGTGLPYGRGVGKY